MLEQPVLITPRLHLRALQATDAATVQRLAGAWEVADTTANIPHPYEDGMAEEWIATHPVQLEKGLGLTYAITDAEQLVGCIGLTIYRHDAAAELGYWVGMPYWGGGYCTEAGHALLAHAFEVIGLNRVFARYMPRNPASGRVMEKLGMSYEGCLRQHVKKNGVYEDLAMYGILRSEWPPSK